VTAFSPNSAPLHDPWLNPPDEPDWCDGCDHPIEDCGCLDDSQVTELDDGFGNVWEKCDRDDCGLQIVRPGKAQCDTCNDDDNEVT
jgi:hypothetical protein